jgi:hypothetical protein
MHVGGMGVIERFANDVLGVLRQMRTEGPREIGVQVIGHGRPPL